jgi:predicted GNAT family acetyltransferase
MLSDPSSEAEESLSQFEGAWRATCIDFPRFELVDLPALKIYWPDVPLMFYNMAIITAPARGAAELRHRAHLAQTFMRTKSTPGMLAVCEEILAPNLRAEASHILATENLYPAVPMIGMAASELHPVQRIPTDLLVRRATSETDSMTILDLNCQAYSLPLELGRESVPRALTDPGWHCYIGELQRQPVACAVTFALDGRLYVALVATLANYRRRGYAEAVVRASLASCSAATGLTRTILHATEAGRPVYKRMGYHDTAKFMLYTQPMSTAA